MGKTIRVSEEYHEWLMAHKREEESVEETLRRMTRGPHPDDVAGLLSASEAKDAKEAVKDLHDRGDDRFEAVRDVFDEESGG